MANNLGIPEVTLQEIVVRATLENTIGAGSRLSPLEPLVVRLMGHDDDVALEEDNPDNMALFVSKAYGHPWIKENGIERIIYKYEADTTPCPSNATYIIPDFDYSTF